MSRIIIIVLVESHHMLSQGPIFTSTPYYSRGAIFNLQKENKKDMKTNRMQIKLGIPT